MISFNHILDRIKPSVIEKEKVWSLSNDLICHINETAKKNDIEAEAVLVGSVAKNTWLGGKADIDIFIKFPQYIDEKDLKNKGLFLGIETIKLMGGEKELRYASHPYVTGFIDGFDVDIVPCYDIESADKLKSAVDRTILHTKYIKDNLSEAQKDEVLLLKKFMESIGAYGAEFKVGGFSGYLCELLIIHYRTFTAVLEAAAGKWAPKMVIDLENLGTDKNFNEKVVVIDPTDEKRNVSAALTTQKISEFIIASRNFLDNPREDYFFSRKINITEDEIKAGFIKRGTKTLIIKFKPPNIPADALYPQIKKTENSLKDVLNREDFKVFNTDSYTDERDKVIILIEMDIWELSMVKKHYGPFVWSKEHQKRFLGKYRNNVYIADDRFVAEISRGYRDAFVFIEDILKQNKISVLRFGKHIKNEILREYQVTDILDFIDLVDEDVLKFLYLYLNKDYNLSR